MRTRTNIHTQSGSLQFFPLFLLSLLMAGLLISLALSKKAQDIRSRAQIDTTKVFEENFNGTPASPEAWQPRNWDVSIVSTALNTWKELDHITDVGHGDNCAPFPATHPSFGSYEQVAFLCRDHLHTSIAAQEYGAVALTPSALIDFTQKEAIFEIDMNTLRRSSNDWVDFWITPFDSNISFPDDLTQSPLSGPPKEAVHVTASHANSKFIFQAHVYHNFQLVDVANVATASVSDLLIPSGLTRTTFELRMSKNRVRFGMPNYTGKDSKVHSFYWLDTKVVPLTWSKGIVQIIHHSNNPQSGACMTGGCGPTTWHFDNVKISPAEQFVIVHADRRFVDPTAPQAITFVIPAPPKSFLRFNANGENIVLSLDGGNTWQAAKLQNVQEVHVNRFQPYWTPIPDGTKSMLIKGEAAKDMPTWMVKDIAIWALQ